MEATHTRPGAGSLYADEKRMIEFHVEGDKEIRERIERSPEVRFARLNTALRAIGGVLLPVLRQLTPRRTGKLAASTRFQIKGHREDQTLEVRQGARTPGGAFYGRFVREGTRPHTILPVRAVVLRFVIDGKVVFAKRARHPGTKANPYHRRAIGQVRSDIQRIVNDMGRAVVAHLTGR